MTPNLILLLTLVSFWPVWVWFIQRVSDGSDEPLGILALVTLCILCSMRPKSSFFKQPYFSTASTAILASSLLVYCGAVAFAPNAAQALIAVLTISFWISGPARIWRLRPGDWMLIVLSLPVVATANFYLGYPLRCIVTQSAATALNLFGTHATAIGTELAGTAGTVEVDAPCSGIKMLWLCAYLAATFSSLVEHSTKRTLLMMGVAVIAALVGNTLRVACLFYIETGLLRGSALQNYEPFLHQTIGVVAFLLSAGMVVLCATPFKRTHGYALKNGEQKDAIPASAREHHAAESVPLPSSETYTQVPCAASSQTADAEVSQPAQPESPTPVPNRQLVEPVPFASSQTKLKLPRAQAVGLCVVLSTAAVLPLLRPQPSAFSNNQIFDWPATFEGRTLITLPITEEQQKFLSGFPGQIRLFSDGQNTIIWRIVAKESRQVHSSSDCYKGMGYGVELKPAFLQSDGRKWNCFVATKGGEKLSIRETINAPDGKCWIDISSWYWDAMLGRTSGPWQVVTIVSKL